MYVLLNTSTSARRRRREPASIGQRIGIPRIPVHFSPHGVERDAQVHHNGGTIKHALWSSYSLEMQTPQSKKSTRSECSYGHEKSISGITVFTIRKEPYDQGISSHKPGFGQIEPKSQNQPLTSLTILIHGTNRERVYHSFDRYAAFRQISKRFHQTIERQ